MCKFAIGKSESELVKIRVFFSGITLPFQASEKVVPSQNTPIKFHPSITLQPKK
jgi:hypothetical protein